MLIIIIFIILLLLSYNAFTQPNDSLAAGVVRVLVVLLDIGFFMGLLLYYFKIRSPEIVLFSVLFMVYLFFVLYGVDVSIFIKILFGIFFILWFRRIRNS